MCQLWDLGMSVYVSSQVGRAVRCGVEGVEDALYSIKVSHDLAGVCVDVDVDIYETFRPILFFLFWFHVPLKPQLQRQPRSERAGLLV